MNELEKQFDHHFQVILSSKFREGSGLGNEVPFFISTFPPEQQVEADKLSDLLTKRLKKEGVLVKTINLFKLCINLLEKDNTLNEYLEYELKSDKANFLNALNSELNVEEKLTPEILKIMEDDDESILFITGVGAVFPVVRTHTILTNLQRLGRKQPTILFFPGLYTFKDGRGSALDLFGKLNEDRYYRAFNLNDYKI